MLYIGAAVAVAVVLLIVLVFLGPALTSSSSPGGGGGALTFYGARPIANQTASQYAGGGWALMLSAGLISPVSEWFSLTSGITGGSVHCNFTAVTGNGSLLIPASAENRSAGTAPAWEFIYRNAAGEVAVVSVTGSQGAVLGTISGSSCTTLFGLLEPVPTQVIDSSAAAASIRSSVSGFLSSYPNASAEFALTGGFALGTLSVGPEWEVLYSTCALSSTVSGSGFEVNATVDALSGRVLYLDPAHAISCGGSASTTPIGTALSMGSATFTTKGAYTNATYQVAAAGDGITWQNLTATLQNSTTIFANQWTLSAVSATNVTIATFNPAGAPGGSWSGDSTAAITAGDQLLLSTTLTITDQFLVLTGVGAFSGTITLPV